MFNSARTWLPCSMTETICACFPLSVVAPCKAVADILFLQGVDLGIVRSDTLDYLERKGFAKDIKKQFTYVTKLYNEEMHVVASKSIRNLRDLDGKTISVDLPNGAPSSPR